MVIFPDPQDWHTNELLRDSPTTNSLNWLSHTHSWCCKSFHDIEDDDNHIDSDLDASDLITNEFLNLRSYSIEFLTRCARPAEFWITTRAWVSQNFLQKTTFSKKSTFRWGAWPPPLLALSWAPTPSLRSSLKGDWSLCSGLSSLWLANGGFENMFYTKKSSSSESWHMGRFHGPLIWKENVNKDVSDIFQVARKSWDGWVYSGRLKVGRVKIQQSFSLSSSINSNLDSRCEKYTFKIGKNCLKCSFKTWIICWWLLLINL